MPIFTERRPRCKRSASIISTAEKPHLSFEDNLRLFFLPGSVFLRYAEDRLRQAFRSPESYNTLLYAMATEHNRISQIAAFSGYPKNKCDKYIKSLDAAGFIEQRTRRDQAGTLRTHYYPKGGYYKTWYELYFPFAAFDTEEEAKNFVSYMRTKFFRALVLSVKISQDAMSKTYRFVPMQDYTKAWTDEELYSKYGLSSEEIAYIEATIKPMPVQSTQPSDAR